MYYYIVDTGKLNQREFERVQQNLYSSISEYHISGEIVRVTGIRTVKQLVETAFFHQAKTIVAVGNDQTLNEVVNVIGDREAVVGYIPLKNTEISEALGLPDISQACKFLAVRRIQDMDLGVANGKYFLSKLSFGFEFQTNNKFDFLGLRLMNQLAALKPFEIQFKVDGKFQGSTESLAGLIINSRGSSSNTDIGNPIDGTLDFLLLPKLSKTAILTHRKHILKGEYEKIPNTSLIHFKELEITAPTGLPIKLGNAPWGEIPNKISIKPQALKIIVGRNRKF
jgi:diacylglycerol kinase family enzyme